MSAGRSALAALALLLPGCSGSAVEGPPLILYGADVCDACRMVISEQRHAAAARVAERELRFDDPGCLLEGLRASEPATGVAWVHDETGAWLPVEEAWFAVDPEGGSPMASGILAFSSQVAARNAATRLGGSPRRWADLGVSDEWQRRKVD